MRSGGYIKRNVGLQAKYWGVSKKKPEPIKSVGRKGKRTEKRDKAQAAVTRALGVCAAQGRDIECSGPLQDAHIMPRRHQRTRLLPENRLPLCGGHHVHFTRKPRRFQALVRLLRPGLWRRLWNLAHHDVLAPKGDR